MILEGAVARSEGWQESQDVEPSQPRNQEVAFLRVLESQVDTVYTLQTHYRRQCPTESVAYAAENGVDRFSIQI